MCLPRQCLGTQLAWRETRLFIAKLLWGFDVEMAPGQKRIDFDRDSRCMPCGRRRSSEFDFVPSGGISDLFTPLMGLYCLFR